MPIALEGPRRGSLTPDVDFPTPVDNQAPSEMTGNSILICDGSPLNSLSGHERQQDGERHHHEVLAAGLYVPHDSGEESSERTMVASMEPRVACDLKPADKDTDKDLGSIVGQSSISGYNKGFFCPHPSVKSSCFVACLYTHTAPTYVSPVERKCLDLTNIFIGSPSCYNEFTLLHNFQNLAQKQTLIARVSLLPRPSYVFHSVERYKAKI